MTDDTSTPTGGPSAPASDEVFVRGLDAAGAVVAGIQPDEWDRQSPCPDWTARDVLGHLFTTMAMGRSILHGEEPQWPDVERPGELVGDDPSAQFEALAADLRAELVGADLDETRDTPMGERTIGDGLAFPAIDLYVHGWDMATSVGRAFDIPDDAIALAHHHIDPIPVEMARGDGGAFGPEIDPPADATSTEAFIAWTGRDPRG